MMKKRIQVGNSSIHESYTLLVIAQSRDITLPASMSSLLFLLNSSMSMKKGYKAVLFHKLAIFSKDSLDLVD